MRVCDCGLGPTLEVLAEDRGKGAGRALLQHAENSARTAGAATIWLHVDAQNAVAVSLYEAAGYTLKGEEADYYGRGRAALVYTRRLART
jgi:ribosomal-protein-alanine N-acetyltransferase